MPTLFLPPGEASWPRDILEVMLDPSRRRTNEFQEAATLDVLIKVADRMGDMSPALRDLLWPVMKAGCQTGPRMRGYVEEDRKNLISHNLMKGALAGAIFLHVLGQKSSSSEHPTLENAFKGIYQASAPQIVGAGGRRLREAWTSFSAVSHLWAMTTFWPQDWAESFQSHEGAMKWISTAAVLLKEGLDCKLWRSKRPTLLDSENAWSLVPPDDGGDSLPDVTLNILLPTEIADRFASYAKAAKINASIV